MAEGSPPNIEKVDYLIVGAGISGLFCGYQLIKNGIQPNKIRVFEKRNRIGGLLKSEIVEINGHTIKQEEGGMRFYRHHKVWELANELGLGDNIVEFKMGGDNNLNYCRGQRFTHDPNDSHIWFKTYNTNQEVTEGLTPYDVLNNVFYELKNLNDKDGKMPTTPEDWQNVRLKWTFPDPHSNEPVPLYKWDFEYLLRQMDLSPEALKMIQYSVGFKSIFNRNVNAGFGFQLNLDFSLSDSKFYTLKCGYDLVPTELCKRLEAAGTGVQLNSEVVRIHQGKGDFPTMVEYVEEGNTKEIHCKFLVLAIPKLALHKLAQNNEIMNANPIFIKYLNSVISSSMVKINLYFERQWWTDLNITDGPNYTDLKLGSVYPISPILKKDLKLHETLKDYPGSLTIYCDYENSIYWKSLQLTEPKYNSKSSCKYKFEDNLQESVKASEMAVKVALDQLKLLFQHPNIGCHKADTAQDEIIPDWPVLATFTHWTDETFGDSTHAWKVHVDDGVVSTGMYNVLGENIAIIGESFSIAQGWVEGSLNHTEGFLKQHSLIS